MWHRLRIWRRETGRRPATPERDPWLAAARPDRGTGRGEVILQLVGVLLMVSSLTMIPPVLVALWYGDGADGRFLVSFLIQGGLGLLAWLPVRRRRLDLRTRDGFLVITVFWVVLCGLGALLFMLGSYPHMPLVDAVFEATSGYTTTGTTVLSGLDRMPHALLYYRAQLNFVGGLGIVVLAVALLPMLGIGGMQLYRAETPGPMKDEKLTPRIQETGRRLWYVYVGLVAACIVAFMAAGMGGFDAVCHAFATLSLGGFSTRDASIGAFHSNGIELVAGIFSVLAGMNFALHFLAWRQRSLWPVLKDPEFRLYALVMFGIIAITCGYLYYSGTFSAGEALSHGFFQTASVVADNGLVTAGYPAWPPFVVVLLTLGSYFGGCAGSTGGGIKAVRFLLLARSSRRELRVLNHPAGQFSVRFAGRAVPFPVMLAVGSFFFLYVGVSLVLSLALMALGSDPWTAFGAVAGCLNNMGVGLGETGTSFGGLSETAKWLLTLAMLLGRLELFPVLLLVNPEFWRG